MKTGILMALGAITDAELKPEVDAEADEEHKKSHGNHVESADQKQPCRGRNRKANRQADRDRGDDPKGMKGQPEDYEHPDDRHGNIERGALLQRAELLVVDWDPAGLSDSYLLGAEVEIGRKLRNHLGSRAPGLKCGEIEHGFDLDKAALVGSRRRLAA